jgi:Ca2+-binding RTX toxin-like protein
VDQVVPADYECEDEPGGSGLASCVGPVADGALIDTSTVGPVAFTVTATDNAGNEAEVTHTYTVVPRPLCRNRSVTVDLALGEDPTSGPDVIRGTNGADDIAALGGDDVVCGRNGADDISLGNGNDIGDGGSKADVITGGDGADKVFGGNGNDLLRGSDGNDHLNGGDGRDALLGQGGNDQLVGGTRRDDCNGGPGIDTGQQCEVKTNIP